MYHISPTTGNPNICRAQDGNCPFAAESEHYATKAEAREAYESKQGEAVSAAPLKKYPVLRPKPEVVATDTDSPFDGRVVAGTVAIDGETEPSIAVLQDGSIELLEPRAPLDPMTDRDRKIDEQRRKMVKSLAQARPLVAVINADFPVDAARDFLAKYPESDLQDVSEAAFSKTLAGTNIDLKDQLFRAASERYGGLRAPTFNEYVAYADLVEVIRQPEEVSSVSEPKTDEGKAVAEAKNPMAQAIYTFRGKTSVDSKIARDVLEQAFPNMVSGISDTARASVFKHAEERSANWGEFVEEYSTAARVASAAKSASKRPTPPALPRNYEEAGRQIKTAEEAQRFVDNYSIYLVGSGADVEANVEEISEELQERFPSIH